MYTIRFTETSQLFSSVSQLTHMCMCASMLACVYTFCSYVWADAMCVDKEWNIQWEIDHWGYVWVVFLCICSKKFIPLQDLFFTVWMKKRPAPHLVPVCQSTLLFTTNMYLPQGFKQLTERGGNIKWPTAQWAVSSLKVREERIRPEGCQYEFLNRLGKSAKVKWKTYAFLLELPVALRKLFSCLWITLLDGQ